jgi:hypothetical protein
MHATIARGQEDAGIPSNQGKKANGIEQEHRHYKAASILAALVAGFVLLQFFLPLRTAIQIGADEGFELTKATLCLKGHHLYTEIWNDQPPLHTFLITQVLKYISPSILGPRLLTTGFTVLLLSSIFLICLRVNGLTVAALTTAFLIASPGFLELSASCMLEIPALAAAVSALCFLLIGTAKWRFREIVSGILFGIALQIKLVPAILLSLAAIILWIQHSKSERQVRNTTISLLVLGLCLVMSVIVIDFIIERGAYLLNFQQSWSSHFGHAKSADYGSASEHPFEWSLFLKNWDTSIPALYGIIFLTRRARSDKWAILPLAWLGLALLVFGTHKPWWSYYYIHTAIPLCWCAAAGLVALVQSAKSLSGITANNPIITGPPIPPAPARARNPNRQSSKTDRPTLSATPVRFGGLRLKWVGTLVLYGLCALPWMTGRVYLQVKGIRNLPQTYSTPVLARIERLKPFTEWIYAQPAIYSFHTGIPMPPELAVVPLKRLWSGEMTTERIAEELRNYKPGMLLLLNSADEMPWRDLINKEYRLIYQDDTQLLYARPSVIAKARR